MPENLYQFGMIGVTVMGANLLINLAGQGSRVIGYDINPDKTKNLSARKGTVVKGTVLPASFASIT